MLGGRKIAFKWWVVFGGLLSTCALADSEDFFDLAPEHLSKLKITAASAFAESALDSSATVSVVSRADWERRGARTLPDAVMHLPGVMLIAPPDGGLVVQVRSYDSSSIRGRATLIDGVPINTFAFGSEVFSNAEMQLAVMDNLELVRGPSSILYGSDAFHSALLLSTYHGSRPEFEVSSEVGSRNYQRVSVRGTQLIGDDKSLQFAVSAAHQGDQGAEYPWTGPDKTRHSSTREQSYHGGTGMLRFEGRGESVGYHLQLFIDQTSANEFPGAGTIFGNVRDLDIADHNSKLWMLKGELSGDVGWGWNWQWDNYFWRNDYGQDYFLVLDPKRQLGLFSNEDQQILEHRYGSRLYLKRPNLEFLKSRTQLAFSAGTERASIDDHHVVSLWTANPPDYEGLAQTINSVSLEGKSQWQDGRWQLIYGGRIDDYSTFGSQTSPRLGMIWMPASDYSIKALYGKAFRAPNANELRGTNFALGSTDLKPETLDSYELAFTHARNNWLMEVVGFKTRWHDRIVLAGAPMRRYTNVGESESRGVELSVKYNDERWRAELSGSRIQNDTIQSASRTAAPDVFPRWIVDLGLGYRWPESRTELFWSNRLHEDVKSGDQALATEPLPRAGLFYRSDISLRQQWGNHWQGQLSVRNIFNRDNVWPSIVNSYAGVPDIPRQVSLELEYRSLP